MHHRRSVPSSSSPAPCLMPAFSLRHTGTLCFIQEVLASHIAKTPAQRPPKDAPRALHALADAKVDIKAAKMALYGFLVSAPLGHALVGLLQRAFAGKQGAKARVGQILASNLLVAPVQSAGESLSLVLCGVRQRQHGGLMCGVFVVYLACMAVINGAKTMDEVVRTVKAGFMSVIRVSLVLGFCPLSAVLIYLPLGPMGDVARCDGHRPEAHPSRALGPILQPCGLHARGNSDSSVSVVDSSGLTQFIYSSTSRYASRSFALPRRRARRPRTRRRTKPSDRPQAPS